MNGSSFWSRIVNFFDLTKTTLLIAVVALIVILLVAAPIAVSGQSMEPNFHSGQIVIVEHLSYFQANTVRRGDVVAARFPADASHTKLIKRVIGLPGESVFANEGIVYVNGRVLDETSYAPTFGSPPYVEAAAVTLGPNEYFLAGDNRPGSSDSRLWGPVQSQDILGRVGFVAWPPSQIRYVGRAL